MRGWNISLCPRHKSATDRSAPIVNLGDVSNWRYALLYLHAISLVEASNEIRPSAIGLLASLGQERSQIRGDKAASTSDRERPH